MPDPATALSEHKAHCWVCRAEMTRPGAPLCSERIRLTREFRAGLRDAPSSPVEQVQEDGGS